jgi:hypothetical protein
MLLFPSFEEIFLPCLLLSHIFMVFHPKMIVTCLSLLFLAKKQDHVVGRAVTTLACFPTSSSMLASVVTCFFNMEYSNTCARLLLLSDRWKRTTTTTNKDIAVSQTNVFGFCGKQRFLLCALQVNLSPQEKCIEVSNIIASPVTMIRPCGVGKEGSFVRQNCVVFDSIIVLVQGSLFCFKVTLGNKHSTSNST